MYTDGLGLDTEMQFFEPAVAELRNLNWPAHGFNEMFLPGQYFITSNSGIQMSTTINWESQVVRWFVSIFWIALTWHKGNVIGESFSLKMFSQLLSSRLQRLEMQTWWIFFRRKWPSFAERDWKNCKKKSSCFILRTELFATCSCVHFSKISAWLSKLWSQVYLHCQCLENILPKVVWEWNLSSVYSPNMFLLTELFRPWGDDVISSE